MGLCKLYTMYTVLLPLLILLSYNVNSVAGSFIPPMEFQRSLQDDCQPKQNLEYYSIPPFAIQFTTLDVNEIPSVINSEIVISETDAKASSLTYPLKMATQEFLMAHFEEQIGGLSSSTERMYQEYYQQLAEVELKVVLKHNPKVTDIPGHVALIAAVHGTLHFVHSFGCSGDTTLIPSQSEVTITFGAWLETILETKRDEYLQRLLSNHQELLREIVELTLIPNYYRDEPSSLDESWIMVVWVVVGLVGLCGLVVTCRFMLFLKGPTYNDGDTHHSSSQLDSKQHGMDISAHRRHSQDVLNKSEQYLTKHRPDLTEEGSTRRSSFSKPFENIMSVFDLASGGGGGGGGDSLHSPGKTPRGRRSFGTRQQSSIELQAGNIAANSEDPSPFDDISLNHDSEEAIMMAAAAGQSSLRPISNIWRSMTSFFRGSSYHNENDGIMKNATFFFDGNEEEYFAKLEEERLREEQWMTFMKEEEKEYNFPFKDFPRKDGTPCLIYNGSNDADPDDIFTVRSPKASKDGDGESDMLNEREILSDEAFRQLLNINASPSFEDTPESLPALGYKSPEFNERLSSLFSEKHRQYEKRSIVERHQQKRKKEREMERRERQKDMHRELEALEVGMAMSDKWRSKHHVSPRPYDLSPARPSYSPNIHIRRSPAGRSPIPHIPNPRRSPVPMTGSIPPRHSASKSFDLDDITNPVQLIRPRLSRPPPTATPPSELFVTDPNSRYQYSADIDPSTLDKLSMPAMSKAHPPNFEMPPRNPSTIHRRVNSTDNLPLYSHTNSRNLETIGAMTTTPPRRGVSRASSPLPGTRGMSPIRPIPSATRGMSPIRPISGATRGISPSPRTGARGMSPARTSRMSSAARRATSPATRGRGSVRGLSPKPGPRSASNSSRHSREGSLIDHGIAALF